MDKRFWAVIGIIIIFFVGFIALRNDASAPASDADPTNHTKGDGTAITLVEYGDFQCPACVQYYAVLEQVIDKYRGDITFQYRHFPLVSIHPNAFGAARAAEAASKQGKFWEMYDRLFAGQNDWSGLTNPNSLFETYASMIGLDAEQYKTDFASTEANDAINADLQEARRLDLTATPTFVLNGRVIETPPATLEAFSEIIDAELGTAEN